MKGGRFEAGKPTHTRGVVDGCPRKVEEALLSQHDMNAVAVVGRQNPGWGEEVVAFVVKDPRAAVQTEALDALCLDRIARFKRPKTYFSREALPKDNYGKVLKTELRARLERGETGDD